MFEGGKKRIPHLLDEFFLILSKDDCFPHYVLIMLVVLYVIELDCHTPHGPLRKPSVLLYVKEWNFIYNLLKVAVVLNGNFWCSQLAPCIPNLECSSLKDNEMVIL